MAWHKFLAGANTCLVCKMYGNLTSDCPGPTWCWRVAAAARGMLPPQHSDAFRASWYVYRAGFNYREGYGWYQKLEG